MVRPHDHEGGELSAAAAQARDTPGPAAAPAAFDGCLFVHLDRALARYECYRPGCPKPDERPADRFSVKAFIDGIKARHLRQYHGGTS